MCLEVVLNRLDRHPMPPFRHTVGFSATGTLDRKAFGIDAWEGVIGDTVELRIEAEAVRRGGGTPAAETPATGTPADDAPAPQPPATPPDRPT